MLTNHGLVSSYSLELDLNQAQVKCFSHLAQEWIQQLQTKKPTSLLVITNDA